MGGLFGSTTTPAIPPAVRQPTPDDPAALQAQRQAVTQLQGLQGRESTDLTGPENSSLNSGGQSNNSGSFINDVLGK